MATADVKRPRNDVTMASLKEKHEVTIADEFLKTLGFTAEFLRRGKDGVEPDVIYSVAERTLGIEIATAYYNEAQPKAEWQLARGITKFVSRIMKMGLARNPDKLISWAVQREIDDKCSKRYSGVDSIWLCIYQHAPLADVAETEDLLPRLKIPSEHPFEKIYLGFYAHARDGGSFRVYELLSASGGSTLSR
jgi:hypothetical protein